jgi:hypothetical protein
MPVFRAEGPQVDSPGQRPGEFDWKYGESPIGSMASLFYIFVIQFFVKALFR